MRTLLLTLACLPAFVPSGLAQGVDLSGRWDVSVDWT